MRHPRKRYCWRPDAELAIKVAALLVALFGVYQYFNDNRTARQLAARQAALQYVTSYDSVDSRAHRQKLSEFWIRNSDAFLWMQKNGVSSKDYESFLLASFENDKNSHDLLNAVYDLTNFYDQLALCREAGICDGPVVTSYFCKSAKDFNHRYSAIFVQLGVLSGAPDFANGMKVIGQQC